MSIPDLHRVRMAVGRVVLLHANGDVDVEVAGDGVLRQVSTLGRHTVGQRVLVFMADLEAWAIGGTP